MIVPVAPVTVAGGGPAAWAVAAELAARGIEVVVANPAPGAPWPATYGCWVDDVEHAGLDPDAVGRRFDRVTAIGTRPHSVGRPYLVIDNQALADGLRRRAANATLLATGVRRVRDLGSAVEVTASDGSTFLTSVVIDATGSEPALVTRHATRRPVPVQAAFGLVARFDRPPGEPGSFTLMDWRPAPGSDPATPSFLYTFELGDGWWLAEETSLARAPSLSLGELRRRLERRLESTGSVVLEQRAHEEVAIPMGHPVPPAQLPVGFGAAGGLVHPATGYSLGGTLRAAPVLADAVAEAIAAGSSPATTAAACWSALWPADRRRARALQEYGLDVLLRLDAPTTAAFFDAFFELPPDLVRAYLDPRPEVADVVRVMRTLFAAAPWRLRSALVTGDPRRLASAFVRRG